MMNEENPVGRRVYLKYQNSDVFDKSRDYEAEIISDTPGPFFNSPTYVVEYWEPDNGTNEIYRINREDFEVI